MSVHDAYWILQELKSVERIDLIDGTFLVTYEGAMNSNVDVYDLDDAPYYLIEPWEDPTPIHDAEDLDKALIADLSPDMAIVLNADDRFKVYMHDSEFTNSDAFDPVELFDLAVEYGREDAVESLIPYVGPDALADGLRIAVENGHSHNEVMDLLLPHVPPGMMDDAITACIENGDTERADYIREFVAERDKQTITAGLAGGQPEQPQPRKARRM
ncbi:hypothetical protein [Pseudoxanthomonas winnipegensis]|uniref:hypothetical protein n=1 Tax=Pseudoxanthomonas winnipegensis TaxID=2480810 RepID=UPI0010397B82|nr:hypothetical protein [Pseudoxanthomonas winnipegensis]TBV69744.1 hypothetical protein EYC45_19030 [Pseudoxanthomonas winnipegensis]